MIPARFADARWMDRALAEAARGLGLVEPNPLVGAVVVREGELVGVGFHPRFGGPHAEVVALSEAGESARGATLYVTLEPCCHHGKTPPCTDAILAAGVRRVVAAMRDPFPRVAGGGFQILEAAGVEVEVGVSRAAAQGLNAPYLKRLITRRPFVIGKWAMTLDGKTATSGGRSFWISGEESRARVHELRGRVNAIVVGIGTALADDPSLTARPPGARVATRVVLDSVARLPLESRLVQTASEVPVLVAVGSRAAAERIEALRLAGCEVLAFDQEEQVPVGRLLDDLGSRSMTNVLVEGGGRTLGAFFDAGEVDAVDVFLAPVIEAGAPAHVPAHGRGVGEMWQALRLASMNVSRVGADVRMEGWIDRPWRAAALASS